MNEKYDFGNWNFWALWVSHVYFGGNKRWGNILLTYYRKLSAHLMQTNFDV
jgi:prophage maintenance system killer protein